MTDNAPHILVVDDELSMRELLGYMLKREGYRVDCAENGRTAVARVEQNHYALLLCDIRLGDISGLDVLRACNNSWFFGGRVNLSAIRFRPGPASGLFRDQKILNGVDAPGTG